MARIKRVLAASALVVCFAFGLTPAGRGQNATNVAATSDAHPRHYTRPSPALERKIGNVENLRFFAGGIDISPGDKRQYMDRFASGTTQYIYYELALALPKGNKAFSYKSVAVWYGPDGKAVRRQTSKQYVPEDQSWKYSWWTQSYGEIHGFRNQSGDTFAPGEYRLEISIDGEKVADGSFDVFQTNVKGPPTDVATIDIYTLKKRDLPSDILVNGKQFFVQPKSSYVEATVPEGKTYVLSGDFSFPEIARVADCAGLSLDRIAIWGLSGDEERTRLMRCIDSYRERISAVDRALQSNTPTDDVVRFCSLHLESTSGYVNYYSRQDALYCHNFLAGILNALSDIDIQSGYRKSVPRVEFYAERGKTYYLRFSDDKNGNKLEIVDTKTAEAEMTKLHHPEP